MLISEMTLEELQDYAKGLEDTVAAQKTELEGKDTTIAEYQALNVDLQKRNQDLFKKVEQRPAEASQPVEEAPAETCEDFAAKNYKGVIK